MLLHRFSSIASQGNLGYQTGGLGQLTLFQKLDSGKRTNNQKKGLIVNRIGLSRYRLIMMIDKDIPYLWNKIGLYSDLAESLGMDYQKSLQLKSLLEEMIDVLKRGQPPSPTTSMPSGLDAAEIPPPLMEEGCSSKRQKTRSSRKERRYLYVLNDFEIQLLDLKQRENEEPLGRVDGVPILPLPKAATLNLMERGYPVLGGLFSLGSDVLMIGGQELRPLQDPDPNWNNYYRRDYPLLMKPHSNNVLAICDVEDKEGATHATYCVGVGEDPTCLTLCSDSSSIKELRRSKLWAVVEEVNGQMHTFNSLPGLVRNSWWARKWTFSHEVLVNKEGEWRQVDTTGLQDLRITNHLVVGHRIYAQDRRMGRGFVFDSDKGIWEEDTAYSCNGERGLYAATGVWDIMGHAPAGGARWVGGEALRSSEDADEKLYYVIIALVPTNEAMMYTQWVDDDYFPQPLGEGYVGLIAYLVDSMGIVVWRQRVDHLFNGAKAQLYSMYEGRIIKKDREGNSKKMCAIVNGNVIQRISGQVGGNYLFIHDFSVKLIDGALSKVVHCIKNGMYLEYVPFVRVRIKARHIYKMDEEIPGFIRFDACFQN